MLKNLLIVEDNRSMRRLIKSVVEDLALLVHEYTDGTEALNVYKAHCPEWVLMDVEMKRVDGLTATCEITTLYPKAKTVILTKYGTGQNTEPNECVRKRDGQVRENTF